MRKGPQGQARSHRTEGVGQNAVGVGAEAPRTRSAPCELGGSSKRWENTKPPKPSSTRWAQVSHNRYALVMTQADGSAPRPPLIQRVLYHAGFLRLPVRWREYVLEDTSSKSWVVRDAFGSVGIIWITCYGLASISNSDFPWRLALIFTFWALVTSLAPSLRDRKRSYRIKSHQRKWGREAAKDSSTGTVAR